MFFYSREFMEPFLVMGKYYITLTFFTCLRINGSFSFEKFFCIMVKSPAIKCNIILNKSAYILKIMECFLLHATTASRKPKMFVSSVNRNPQHNQPITKNKL